jgi:hypothetical protein
MKECSDGHLVQTKRCWCGKATLPYAGRRFKPVPLHEIRKEGPKVWEAHRGFRAALRHGIR